MATGGLAEFSLCFARFNPFPLTVIPLSPGVQQQRLKGERERRGGRNQDIVDKATTPCHVLRSPAAASEYSTACLPFLFPPSSLPPSFPVSLSQYLPPSSVAPSLPASVSYLPSSLKCGEAISPPSLSLPLRHSLIFYKRYHYFVVRDWTPYIITIRNSKFINCTCI